MTREDELYADELRDRAYSDYERLDLAIQALEAQPTDEIREAYIKGYDYGVKDWFKSKTQPCEDYNWKALWHQVKKERDIAISQLHELGYEFGEKIEPCEDFVSRSELLRHQHIIYDDDEEGYNVVYVKDIKAMPPVTPSYNSIKTELKPCEDCISRAEVLRHSHTEYDDDGEGHKVIYTEDIEELPSVTPRTNLAGLHKQTGSA